MKRRSGRKFRELPEKSQPPTPKGKVRRRSQKPDGITEKTSEPPESRAGHTVLKEPPCARVEAQTWATKSPEKDPVRKRGRNSLSLKDTREIREREPPNSNTY